MSSKDYYQKHKDYLKKYREDNKELLREQSKKYYEANKERILQRFRKYGSEEYILERYKRHQKTYQDVLESQQLAKEFFEKIKDRVGHIYN